MRYRVVVRHSAEKDAYVARVPEITGCEGEGATRAEALASVEQELAAQLENIKDHGVEPPMPVDEQDLDGQLSCKVTPELHRELVFLARESSVELEVLLVELLSRAVQQRQRGGASRAPRQNSGDRDAGGGRRGGGPAGQRYHDIMENKAEFMEYVRSLEGGGRGRRGGGGPRGGR